MNFIKTTDRATIALVSVLRVLGLFMAILSVMLYAAMVAKDYFPWFLFCWVPISLGYFLWFSEFLEDLFLYKMKGGTG